VAIGAHARPFAVAITGGIASGKSAVADRFVALGAVLVDADLAAREVVAPGEPALAEIAARFGPRALQDDGTLDRAWLRAHVFADATARADLEALTHPRIRARLLAQAQASDAAYVLVAIPLLAEGGGRAAYPWLRRILVVDAPDGVRQRRLMARDHIDAALAERMLQAQAPRASRLALATDVIVNDGAPSALDAPVARLDALYRRMAAESA
jgi:dephospho-CoA kinase